jgi:two-component system, NtrC family, sensor kinase
MSRISFLVIFTVLFHSLRAQLVINHELKGNIEVSRGISFLEDKSGKLTINDVVQNAGLKPVKEQSPNFGISPSTFWLKISLLNQMPDENYILQVSQPALDEIDFYEPLPGGSFRMIKGGEVVPFGERQFFDPNYLYSVQLPKDKVTDFYLRIAARDNLKIPVIIGRPAVTFESNKTRDYILGIFAGIMLVMFLYNSFLYITIRDQTYLYYIAYIAMVFLTQISIQGYSFQYLWPNSAFMAQWSPFIFSPLVGIAAAYFMRLFLNTKFYSPKADKIFKYFNYAYGVAFLIAVAGFYAYSYLLITLVATFISLFMFAVGIVVFRKHYKPARFFLVAWSMFLTGVTVYAMTNLGVLPLNTFTFYIMPAGAAAEVVLLSLALADRINVLKREKEQSQAEALLISQQNQKLITEQNIVLEQKVHERTLMLEEANEELNSTLTDLKEAQSQLVNAEKMASLGQLTAGIAHEINNPINFVSANLKPLKLDISEVFDVVKKYEAITPGAAIEEKLKDIEAYKQKIDLPYLEREIHTLLHGIEDGARRTTEIVSGLKNFSRLDESDIKEANINEGIESTLVILRSSIPNGVDVITQLGKIPHIECYPGKLNQVFMNVLSNAIYAIRQNKAPGPKYLKITTFMRGDNVCATFEDTGIGMTKEVKEKIFEPFFTTKDVGEGTGLGMSIVFKIIESHHAKMEIESEPGKGTLITIVLNKRITGMSRSSEPSVSISGTSA